VRSVGDDDDNDCPDHVWGLVEVVVTAGGAAQVKRCSRCPAISYQPGHAALGDRRPPLTDGAGDTR